jgi:uncharacterized alpha-E superfamily protein
MNRNDAFTFMMLGRNLERADMTSRIVDVRSAQLLPADTPELRPFDTIQWMSVLKSLSGYEMYRLCKRTRVARTDVLEFVVRGDQFPRACFFCLKQIEQCLSALPRGAGVLDVLAGVMGFLGDAQLGILDQAGLHELIDRLQLHINGVHVGIAQTYFPPRSGATTMRQLQWSDSGVTTLPLFADAPN